MTDPALSAVLADLASSWQRQGIAGPALPAAYVKEVCAVRGLILPPDFHQFYCAVNGTPGLYPNWLDEKGFSFLPIEALETRRGLLHIIPDNVTTKARQQVTVFVDYMHRSWEYGFIAAENETGYLIGIIPSEGIFKVLTSSLTTFLAWYLRDADELYDYGSDYPPEAVP
ncbi:hypothetical protein [Hymenobacter sp. B81]|uniref:hypothetical protein n=1 Tax=Hymenobacter sp. B81 TaxID=3344878 RepID=UPI0037DCFBC4